MFAAGDLETVYIVRPPEKDNFGDPIAGTGEETAVPGCLFAPGATEEMLVHAQQVQADATVYAPAGTTVSPADRLRIRGELYEVVGRLRDWGDAGVEILVRLTTG